jgi:hypothetical protein
LKGGDVQAVKKKGNYNYQVHHRIAAFIPFLVLPEGFPLVGEQFLQ